MFRNFFKKSKPRVFLGTLAVVPRTDLKKIFDEYGYSKNANLDDGLRNNLTEIFTLPFASEIIDPQETDLGLDVIIPKFQSGDALAIDLGEIAFPLFWRPKIQITSRLYNLKTDKTKMVFSETVKLSWRKFFGRIFSTRAILRFHPVFDREDMEILLYQACSNLLIKMKKKI